MRCILLDFHVIHSQVLGWIFPCIDDIWQNANEIKTTVACFSILNQESKTQGKNAKVSCKSSISLVEQFYLLFG